jgi:hypothetical protein
MNEKEVQAVLQFGLNMALAMGIATEFVSNKQMSLPFND